MTSEAPTDKTILVAEDDHATREWVASVLQSHGYQVVLAANGQEALDYLRRGMRPDLILLDMLMPVLDGWHFLAQLKRQVPQRPIPIMIVTASILTRQWAQDQGCCGFIKKPLDVHDLLAEVRRCLSLSPNGGETSAHP
jgi:CheY-like chemotaxis protein